MSVATVRTRQLRRAILTPAAELLTVRGEVSMSDIAEAVGISRATLYRYYVNREVLLDDLAAFALDDAMHALAEANLRKVPVDEAIPRAFRALVGVGARYCAVLRETEWHPDGEAHAAIANQLRAVIVRGQRDGVLRSDVPAAWLMTALKSGVVAAIELAHHAGVEDAAAFGARQFLGGARPT